MVDGAFYLQRHYKFFKNQVKHYSPQRVARDVYLHGMKHVRKKENEEIYRILFYDCRPVTKKVHHPLTNQVVDLSKSDTAMFRTEFFEKLVRQPMVALRLGELDEKNARWRIRDPKKHKQVITGRLNPNELGEDDYYYHANQKGVDMKIGTDIATLTLKKLVSKIILVAGDSDFVPASKLARREGVKFVLDPMGQNIRADLSEHIDALDTTIPKDLLSNGKEKQRIKAKQ